jgi:hypothetical protein
MITHMGGVSTFTLYSAEICDINEVPSSGHYGKFTDLDLYSDSVAFGFYQSEQNDKDSLVMYEMTSFVSWDIIDEAAMYYRPGFHVRKDNVGMSIVYLVGIDTVMVMNNPNQTEYRQSLPFKVDFPVHDFLFLGHYDLLVCGLSGEVSIHSYDTDSDKKSKLRFKLNLEEREMVSFVKKST